MRPRIKALLRTRAHYDSKAMIDQYKTHIWGIVETHSGAIFHASTYLLDKLDNVQEHFLHELGISASAAFMEYNFAPPTLRRNIGVLGLLHKRVLGLCHPAFETLLPFFRERIGFNVAGRHNKQLYSHCMEVVGQVARFKRAMVRSTLLYLFI